MELVGRTIIKVNDRVVFDKTNAIANDLKEYLKESMLGNVNNSIGANDGLFATNDASPNAGKGGIVVGSSPLTVTQGNPTINTPFQMVTTDITSASAVNTYGARWRGTITATAPRQFNAAIIGDEWNNVNSFETNYASQGFQTIVLAIDDTLTIEWEIAIQ